MGRARAQLVVPAGVRLGDLPILATLVLGRGVLDHSPEVLTKLRCLVLRSSPLRTCVVIWVRRRGPLLLRAAYLPPPYLLPGTRQGGAPPFSKDLHPHCLVLRPPRFASVSSSGVAAGCLAASAPYK